jgi:hypothetical protein
VREKICKTCGQSRRWDQYSPGQASCRACRAKRAREKYQEGRQRLERAVRRQKTSDRSNVCEPIWERVRKLTDPQRKLYYLEFDHDMLLEDWSRLDAEHKRLREDYEKLSALNMRMKQLLENYGERF